jgi:collagen type III alpha
MLQRSPSLVARQTPTNSQEALLNNELIRMPTETITSIKATLGLGDKELHTLGFQDKVLSFLIVTFTGRFVDVHYSNVL